MTKESEIFKEAYQTLKDFLRYLTSVWGLLSIFTPLFPLFNRISTDLHPPKVYPNIFVLFATLIGLFVVYHKFTTRDEEQNSVVARNDFVRALGISIIYLILLPQFESINWEITKTNVWKGLPERLFSTIESVMYLAIFWYFTQSFATLAVVELKKRQDDGEKK